MVFWDWTEMREISACFSVHSGAYLLDVLWRERAAWLLVNAFLGKMRSGLSPEQRVVWDGVGECSPLRTNRQLTLLQMTFTVQTARLVLGGGVG
jgi:hypothetical protein